MEENSMRCGFKQTKPFGFVLCIAVIFLSEFLYRAPLYKASIQLEAYWQDGLNSFWIALAKFFSYMGTEKLYVIVLFLLYNFVNMYKSFVFTAVLMTSMFISSILKSIYASPRPFWETPDITPYNCEIGWGNPSGHSFCSSAVYLTLWKILFESTYLRTKEQLKYISLAGAGFVIFAISFSRIVVGVHGLNQVLFGCLLGIALYIFVFEILCVEVNNPKQFYNLLKIKPWIVGAFGVSLLLLTFLVFTIPNPVIKPEWNERINVNCGSMPENKKFQNESFYATAVALSLFGLYMGLVLLFKVKFKENYYEWARWNFAAVEQDCESLIPNEDSSVDGQWNHTPLQISIIRLFLALLILLVLLLPYVLISIRYNIYVVFFIRCLIPFNLTFVALYYFAIKVYEYCRLVNHHSYFE